MSEKPKRKRDKGFTLFLTQREHEKLEQMAKEQETTKAEILRRVLK